MASRPWAGTRRWADAFAPHAAQGLAPARVAIEFNHLFRLYTGEGELQAQHAGRVLHEAAGRHALAAVGDWVAIRPRLEERTATIEAILPRRSHFSRKAAGELTEQQVVAANIDVVFLVMGLDRDYNPRRLERYLLLARESGAVPHVLLSKADLVDETGPAVEEIQRLAPGVPVDAVSVRDGRGLTVLRRAIGPGQTGALLGSSGAGKSTLINALLGEDRLATNTVRESDSRGRHTTRHRQLVPMPGGGLLIDTPGMRELQLWTTPEGGDAAARHLRRHRGAGRRLPLHRLPPPLGAALRGPHRGGGGAARRVAARQLPQAGGRGAVARRPPGRPRSDRRARAVQDRLPSRCGRCTAPATGADRIGPGASPAVLAPRQLASSCRTRSPVFSAASVSKCRSAKVLGWPIRRNSASKAASERTSG